MKNKNRLDMYPDGTVFWEFKTDKKNKKTARIEIALKVSNNQHAKIPNDKKEKP